MRRVTYAFRVAKGTLKNTIIALKRSTTPQEDVPGIRRSFLIDPDLWERIETDDLKYALKATWREYAAGWRALLNRKTPEDIAAEQREEEAAALASLSEDERKALQQLGDDANAIRKAALDKLDSEKLRLHARGAADKLSAAAKDPSLRGRLADMASTGLVKAHEALDSFLVGYYEAQAQEVEKERAAQAQRAAAIARGEMPPGGLGEGVDPLSFLSDVLSKGSGSAGGGSAAGAGTAAAPAASTQNTPLADGLPAGPAAGAVAATAAAAATQAGTDVSSASGQGPVVTTAAPGSAATSSGSAGSVAQMAATAAAPAASAESAADSNAAHQSTPAPPETAPGGTTPQADSKPDRGSTDTQPSMKRVP